MNNSPATPTGTRFKYRSRTCNRVLPIGRPSETGAPTVTSAHEDQMVVSVGPYMFHNPTPAPTSHSAKPGGNPSPPHNTRRPRDGTQPSLKSIRHVDGVACTQLAPDASNNPANDFAEDATTNRAPTDNGPNNSNPAMSNPNVVTATTTSPAPNPGRAHAEARRFTNEP